MEAPGAAVLAAATRTPRKVGRATHGAGCPDLVILDLYMPKRDGLSALPELKQMCPEARVLVVSAHAAEDTFGRSRARGATACFEKRSFVTRIPRLVERYNGAA